MVDRSLKYQDSDIHRATEPGLLVSDLNTALSMRHQKSDPWQIGAFLLRSRPMSISCNDCRHQAA